MIVLAAAQDTGGANALVPVIDELRRQGQARVVVIARGKASAVFSAAGIKQQPYESIPQILAHVSPDALLLGPAWGPSLDKELIRAANDMGIPSVSVVDMWSNYRERFADPASGELRLPTKVALMDELAFDQAVEAGLPAHVLAITGQPHLERLQEALSKPEVVAKADSLRRDWMADLSRDECARLVLFVSEAFSRDFGPGTPYYRGYTEVDALEGLVEAVRVVERRISINIKVVAKLHPEESPDTFRMGPLAKGKGVLVAAGQPAWPCIRAADVVVGMTSMFLLESAIAGKPTVSFQPGVRDRDSFIGSRVGVVPAASSVDELAATIGALLADGRETSNTMAVHRLMRPGAARRIADLVAQLATTGKTQLAETAI